MNSFLWRFLLGETLDTPQSRLFIKSQVRVFCRVATLAVLVDLLFQGNLKLLYVMPSLFFLFMFYSLFLLKVKQKEISIS